MFDSLTIMAIGFTVVSLFIWFKHQDKIVPTVVLLVSLVVLGTLFMISGSESELEPAPSIQIDIEEAFSIERLGELVDEDKTVMIKFSANWCMTCKVLEKTVLSSREVKKAIKDNNITVLNADWSNRNKEVGDFMENIAESKQVPMVAVLRGNKVTVFKGIFTKKQIIETLNE